MGDGHRKRQGTKTTFSSRQRQVVLIQEEWEGGTSGRKREKEKERERKRESGWEMKGGWNRCCWLISSSFLRTMRELKKYTVALLQKEMIEDVGLGEKRTTAQVSRQDWGGRKGRRRKKKKEGGEEKVSYQLWLIGGFLLFASPFFYSLSLFSKIIQQSSKLRWTVCIVTSSAKKKPQVTKESLEEFGWKKGFKSWQRLHLLHQDKDWGEGVNDSWKWNHSLFVVTKPPSLYPWRRRCSLQMKRNKYKASPLTIPFLCLSWDKELRQNRAVFHVNSRLESEREGSISSSIPLQQSCFSRLPAFVVFPLSLSSNDDDDDDDARKKGKTRKGRRRETEMKREKKTGAGRGRLRRDRRSRRRGSRRRGSSSSFFASEPQEID